MPITSTTTCRHRYRPSTNRVRWAAQYAAFGQTSIISSGDSAINSNLRLPGQYADSESGLYYNWQRYYYPNTGRYISSDPIGLAGGLNRYVYVEGSPVGWVDPKGLYECIYSVSYHRMTCYAQENGHDNFESDDWTSGRSDSEHPGCQDNSKCEPEKNYGPLPSNRYKIGALEGPQGLGGTKNHRELIPIDGNYHSDPKNPNLYDRGEFQTHYCPTRSTCSKGCIASTNPNVYKNFNNKINSQSINHVTVIP